MFDDDEYDFSAEISSQVLTRTGHGYLCEVCSRNLPTKNAVMSHLEGSQHRKALKRRGEEKRLNEILQSESKPAKYTGIEEQDNGYYCQLCDCTCTSSSNVETHVLGMKHATEVKQYRPSRSKPSRPPSSSSSSPSMRRSSSPREAAACPDNSPHLMKLLKHNDLAIGLDFVVEYHHVTGAGVHSWFYSCSLCTFKCKTGDIRAHITGTDHHLAVMRHYKKEVYEHLVSKERSQKILERLVANWAANFHQRYGRGGPICMPMPTHLLDKAPKSKSSPDKVELAMASATPEPRRPPGEGELGCAVKIKTEPPSTNSTDSDDWQMLKCTTEEESSSLLNLAFFLLSKHVEFDLRGQRVPEDKVPQLVEAYISTNKEYCRDFFKKFSLENSSSH